MSTQSAVRRCNELRRCTAYLVQRSLSAKYPILEPKGSRRVHHRVPAPVQLQLVVCVILRIREDPLLSVLDTQVPAKLGPDLRLADRDQSELDAASQELVPPRGVLEDLLLAEGSPERPGEHDERYAVVAARHQVRHRNGRPVEAVHG